MSRSLRPSLPFSPPKSRSHPGREPSQHSLSVSSLFFRTPCEVANASCLIRTRHARINLSKWRRPNRRHSNYGCLVKVAFFRSPLLITIDTQQRAIDDEAPDRDCPTLCVASPRPSRRDSPRSSRYHAVCRQERRGRRSEGETSGCSSSNSDRITRWARKFAHFRKSMAGKWWRSSLICIIMENQRVKNFSILLQIAQ